MIVTLVAAVARNGVIGNQGKLPWHISADLKRFKQITTGHPVVMGRKTYESIGRPLPHRRNLVLTRRAPWPAPAGVEVFPDIGTALEACRRTNETEVFVIGGGQIYRETLPLANRLLITEVPQDVAGDTHFPPIDPRHWQEQARETTSMCAFVEYRRRGNS